MDEFSYLPQQHKVLTTAVDLLRKDGRILGLYLSGSFAKGKPDQYSDIDLNIVVRADQRETVLLEHQAIFVQVGRIATQFTGAHHGAPFQVVVFYDVDGFPIHVDYEYKLPEDLKPDAANGMIKILLERDRILTQWKTLCESAQPSYSPEDADLQYLEDRFWGWAWYTAAKVKRGELWEARDAVEQIRNLVLLRLAYYLTGLRPEGNRRIETKFPPKVLAQLSRSIPVGADSAAYRSALNGLVEEYIELMDEVLDSFSDLRLKMVDRDFFIQAIKDA